MKILFALNLLILVAAVILGDIVFGACAFIGLSGFCSGQLIPDTALSFSSATAGAKPSLN